MSTGELLLTIVCMAAVTLLARTLFLLPRNDLPLPRWLREGLHYAPLAALVAVISPEVLMKQGQLLGTWQEPRLLAALVACMLHLKWRSATVTIPGGMGVLLALKLGLGW